LRERKGDIVYVINVFYNLDGSIRVEKTNTLLKTYTHRCEERSDEEIATPAFGGLAMTKEGRLPQPLSGSLTMTASSRGHC
jgi:hypothetical protein